MKSLCKAAVTFGIMLTTICPRVQAGQEWTGVLSDPVVLGSWLYQSKCVRCHFEYGRERLAQGFDTQRELVKAISEGGCQVTWSRVSGGELGHQELQAIAQYMYRWEEEDGDPQLPDLPPLLPEELLEREPEQTEIVVVAGEKSEKPALEPSLVHVIEHSSVALGGWLYTGNCYRCHLEYGTARMGKGLTVEKIQRFIREGKTSTQMKPFSRALGGNLKSKEINAIVEYITTWERAGESLAIAAQLMTPPEQDPTDFVPLRLTRFPGVSGDDHAGDSLFRANCRSCHGASGEGIIGPSFRKRQWVIRVDLFFKSIVKRGVPESLMPAWDSNSGGSLSAKDIDDVVSFLLKWQEVGDTDS